MTANKNQQNQKNNSGNLLSSAMIVGGCTGLSRIFGFLRDLLIARAFGAGVGADTFFIAFRIPNFLRRLCAEGAFSQAFVPVLANYRAQQSAAEVDDFIAHVCGALALVVGLLSILGVIFAPLLIALFAPGFYSNADKYNISVQMLRITFPYIGFISLVALAGGVLNSYGRFAVPAFTPVFLNIAIIVAVLWISPYMAQPEIGLAFGVFIGGCVQLLFQLPFLWQLGLLLRPRLAWAHQGMRKVLALMMPAMFGASVSQINLLIDTILASFLITGSVSWLYYSDRMVELPLGVFGIALATILLPSLSRSYANTEEQQFCTTLDWALRLVLIIIAPAAVGLAMLATPVLSTLFQYGKFTSQDVAMTSLSLVAYAIGLLGFAYVKVLAPGYFARQDMRTPVRVGLIAMLVNVILNMILIGPLKHVGLAIATAVSAYINAFLLYRGLRSRRIYIPLKGWLALILKVAISLLAMLLWLLWLRGEAEMWYTADGWTRGSYLALVIISGSGIYAATMYALGMRWKSLYRA